MSSATTPSRMPSDREIMTPESVGLKESSLVMGKHSGRHAFREKLKELGYELGDNAFEDAFRSEDHDARERGPEGILPGHGQAFRPPCLPREAEGARL